MHRAVRACLLAVVGLSLLAGEARAEDAAARQVVARARLEAKTIPAQGQALVRLAWLDPGQPSEVRAAARHDLVEFGAQGLRALYDAVRLVDPRYSLDVAATLLQARNQIMAQVPPEFGRALDQLVWFGTADSKRLAIPLIAQAGVFPTMHACVDAAYDHPELAVRIIRVLPDFRNDRLRFALSDFLRDGTTEEKQAAAESLARMGGRALEELRRATLSPDPETRRTAMEAFLPASRVSDLTALYEFLERVPDEDADLLERVRARAAMLEQLFETMQDEDTAAAEPGT